MGLATKCFACLSGSAAADADAAASHTSVRGTSSTISKQNGTFSSLEAQANLGSGTSLHRRPSATAKPQTPLTVPSVQTETHAGSHAGPAGPGSVNSNPQNPSADSTAELDAPAQERDRDGEPKSSLLGLTLPRTHGALRLANDTSPLSTANLHLCKPSELVQDLGNLTYLGHGSFAAVFYGLWKGTPAAIKFVASDSLSPQSAGLKESLLCPLLSHPNVIQTYTSRCTLVSQEWLHQAIAESASASTNYNSNTWDFSSGDGFGDPRFLPRSPALCLGEILTRMQVRTGQYLAVIIMEYADKGTLQAALHHKRIFHQPPTEQWTRRVLLRAMLRTAREIALGNAHLHSLGVLHGDLKTANILLTSSRLDRRAFTAKLTDFGLSQLSVDPVASGSWATFTYMAPERFSGTVSRATDVYSFGIVLWEMVTGAKPFGGMPAGDIMVAVKSGNRPPWPEDCLPELVALGQACTHQEPDKRPTFEQVAKELELLELRLRDVVKSVRKAAKQAAVAAAAAAGAHPPQAPHHNGQMAAAHGPTSPQAAEVAASLAAAQQQQQQWQQQQLLVDSQTQQAAVQAQQHLHQLHLHHQLHHQQQERQAIQALT